MRNQIRIIIVVMLVKLEKQSCADACALDAISSTHVGREAVNCTRRKKGREIVRLRKRKMKQKGILYLFLVVVDGKDLFFFLDDEETVDTSSSRK